MKFWLCCDEDHSFCVGADDISDVFSVLALLESKATIVGEISRQEMDEGEYEYWFLG